MPHIYQGSGPFLSLAFILIVLEMLWRQTSRRGYDLGAFAASMGVYLGQVVLAATSAAVIVLVWGAAYEVAPIKWNVEDWRVWVVCFFLTEFAYYWEHRLSHTVRWLWATHAVHHSPGEFVLPAAFRLGWTGVISGGWLFFVPIALAGFPPPMIALLLVGGLRYQFFLHTEAIGRLGWFEWVFNTPSNHRVHHSSRSEYLDKNFGSVLMVFDHLFGTYARELPAADMRYGLTQPMRSKNPFVVALREWWHLARDLAGAGTAKRAFIAAFGHPGSASSGGTEK